MTVIPFAFPVLIADIGGTNARFAVIPSVDHEAVDLGTVGSGDYPDPVDAIASLELAARGLKPLTAIMAVAGPVTGDEVRLTNPADEHGTPWTFRPLDLIARLGFERVVLINDFEAQALALPVLGPDDLLKIGAGERRDGAAMVVIGPGTGLGVAGMISAAGRWVPVPGEGGHVSIGPETAEEFRIWEHIDGVRSHIEAEHLVCGRGLVRLAEAVAAADGIACPYVEPKDVTAGATRGDALAVTAVTIFAGLLGRLAGDLALTFLARGGVFLAGGVSQRVAPFLAAGAFRAAFENKAPHHNLVASMPTWLVTHPRAALLGLATLATRPETYFIDLTGRSWPR